MLFEIAWKNVWRNKLRSFVVVLSIAIGLLGGIFYLAFSNGMVQQQVYNSINTEISNIQIHNPRFLVNDEAEFTIENAVEQFNEIYSKF